MTDSDDKHDDSVDKLARAFTERGDLPPTTAAEVERAEAAGVELEGELPESLRHYRASDAPPPSARVADDAPAPSGRVIPLAPRRTAWKSHAFAALLGAAAAATLMLWIGRPRIPPPGVGGETSAPHPDAGPAPSKIVVPPLHGCPASCCGGTACAAASPELKQCSSGRTCVACATSDKQARWRVRIGALALLGAAPVTAPLELCVRAGASVPACAPAHAGTSASEPWTALSLLASAQDALHGVVLEVRAQGVKDPVATWQGPVLITPAVLCNGLALKPKDAQGKVFGNVSLFLDDTHFVALAHSSSIEELSEIRRRYSGASPRIFETTGSGADHFSLELGPTDRAAAEQVRSDLLRQGVDARLVVGDAHVGDALSVP